LITVQPVVIQFPNTVLGTARSETGGSLLVVSRVAPSRRLSGTTVGVAVLLLVFAFGRELAHNKLLSQGGEHALGGIDEESVERLPHAAI
jgi:hypothetical protein